MRRSTATTLPGTGLVVALTLTAGLLSGCGSDDDAPAGGAGAAPGHGQSPPALWNPCDGLDAEQVARLFRSTYTVDAGSDTAPACRFSPTAAGGPALDVNYQIFAGDLAELFESFGQAGPTTQVSTPRVPRADDARLVVDVVEGTLTVTGFVQNGRLVQVVNALDPEPAPRRRVLDGVRAVMTDLAAHAADSEVDAEPAPPTTPPTSTPAG